MSTIELLQSNLLSPMVLAFVLGMAATLLRTDLRIPEGLYNALSVYLLFAVGLKGGAELARASLSDIALPIGATLFLGLLTPFLAYLVARRIGRISNNDAAALAAHYGSVSAVTFMAAFTLTQNLGMATEGFMPALVAVLEVPAIAIALFLANRRNGRLREGLHEALLGKTILLLVGGMLVGLLSGPKGLEQVAPVFVDPFKGALVFFLLEMGTLAASRLRELTGRQGWFLLAFGILVPLFNGILGVYFGHLAGLSVGGSAVLGTMSASASYIAAPAAVRVAIPEANPSLYLAGSLGITFPFNLSLGIPLYLTFAQALA